MKKYVYKILFLLSITSVSILLYYVYTPDKALQLIIPGLDKINYMEAFIDTDTADIDITGVVLNKSVFPLFIDSIQYSFSIDGKQIVTKGEYVKLRLIPGESDTIIQGLKILKPSLKELKKKIKNKDSIRIETHINVIYKYLFRKIKINFSKNYIIEKPLPPQIKILQVRNIKVMHSGKHIRAEIKLLMANHSKKNNIEIRKIRYSLVLENKIAARGWHPEVISLPVLSSRFVIIPIFIVLKNPAKTTYDLLFKSDSIAYHLTARTKMNKLINDKVEEITFNVDVKGYTSIPTLIKRKEM